MNKPRYLSPRLVLAIFVALVLLTITWIVVANLIVRSGVQSVGVHAPDYRHP